MLHEMNDNRKRPPAGNALRRQNLQFYNKHDTNIPTIAVTTHERLLFCEEAPPVKVENAGLGAGSVVIDDEGTKTLGCAVGGIA